MAKKKKKVVSLTDSLVTNSEPKSVGEPEGVRRKNNGTRDARTALGRGKPSSVVTK